jgi:hypothetical protein
VARRRVGEFCGDEMDAFVFCELYTIYFLHALKTQTQIHTHTHTRKPLSAINRTGFDSHRE